MSSAQLLVTDSGGDGSGGRARGVDTVARPRRCPADNGTIAAVAEQLLPSTVQIVAEYDGEDGGATGSGFVLDKQGHVITNNHVVADAAEDDGPIEIVDQRRQPLQGHRRRPQPGLRPRRALRRRAPRA